MSAPRKSAVATSNTFLWSNGTNFDGWLIIGIVPPQAGGVTNWPSMTPGDMTSPVALPPFYQIRIRDGRAETATKVIYTSDIVPPNTTYVAWLCDVNKRLMTSTASATFTVTSDTFSPPAITATIPSVGNDPPEVN